MKDDPVWSRDEPDSPCQNICVMHPTSGLCLGCLRTLDEIAAWGKLDAASRRAILAELPDRKSQITGKRRRRNRD